MQTEIILSGFGGQGALFAGTVLAQAAMNGDLNVTWIPSYGPEMRGGTAHVMVIISDKEIGSPLVRRPGAVIALNNPSIEKYEPLVKAGGILVYNSSLISNPPGRADLHIIAVPASDIATKLGDIKVANMVMLGTLIAATGVLPLTAVVQAVGARLSGSKGELAALNEQALRRGAQIVEAVNA
jgi:2-oxoglutarate ferredoxin oxidoreductase subunit gamma